MKPAAQSMSPETELIFIDLIKATVFYLGPDVACAKYNVSRTYLRKKCGYRPPRRGF